MKWLWFGLGSAVLVGFVVFLFLGRGAEMLVTADIDTSIVQPYIAYVTKGDYTSAYALLTRDYREEVPLEKFRIGHEKRKADLGTITTSHMIRDRVLYNIFSSKPEVRLKYELYYGKKRRVGWICLEQDNDRFAVDGTYRETAGDTLAYELW
ncbi:hypothetical protein [Thiorhodovibrio frisius]|uniref:Uncharacterized protein n=1 Tax=Thiorhodovibrio frisius TaxID=631362 RepID=H8Z6R6_9GAMM|nr:hypothetical protein [Thiorhodovibrio frisius]EIC20782.1 hypothetical protein Thi970DRAFT_04439 [Thiorhodovibrio frisius]WPL21531.1 hypothetical protein Thiofri_01657 [Thiorhodovibrio frisius]